MGCNAWNHPPECNCGWGGAYFDSSDIVGRHHWKNTESYTVPNAMCPVCGTKVFFYKSPFGGRVYFDKLGPPWPKHICTTQNFGGSRMLQKYNKYQTLKNREDEWSPLFFSNLKHRGDLYIEIVSEIHVKNVPNIIYARRENLIFIKDSPLFFRKLKIHDGYEISTLNVHEREPSEVKFFAAKSIDNLNNLISKCEIESVMNNKKPTEEVSSSVNLIDIDEFDEDEDDVPGVVDLRPKIDHPFSSNQKFSDFVNGKLVEMVIQCGGTFHPKDGRCKSILIFIAPISYLSGNLLDSSNLDPLNPSAVPAVLTGRCLGLRKLFDIEFFFYSQGLIELIKSKPKKKGRPCSNNYYPLRPFSVNLSDDFESADLSAIKNDLEKLYYCPVSRLVVNESEYKKFYSEVNEIWSVYQKRQTAGIDVSHLSILSSERWKKFDELYSQFVLYILGTLSRPLYVGSENLNMIINALFPGLGSFDIMGRKKDMQLNALLFINHEGSSGVIYVVINDMLTSHDWERMPLTRNAIESIDLSNFSRLSYFGLSDERSCLYKWKSLSTIIDAC